MLVAMHLEDVINELGHKVAEIATRIDNAIEIVRRQTIDLAVLDLNVAGVMSYPVADALRERGIPFLFASGYGRGGVSEGYNQEIVLQKPVDPTELSQAIEQALSG